MVICCVIGCSKRSGRDDLEVKFYRIPCVRSNCAPAMRTLSANRRALWLLRICRKDLDDSRAARNGSRVCSRHFVSGSPAILEDITNPDWAPSLHLGHDFFDNKRKPCKIKGESSQKCFCNSYGPYSKYQRNYKKSSEEEVTGEDTSCASKNACCYMNAVESDDIEDERSCDEPANNECITHITVTSGDTGDLLLQPNYARSILKPKHARSLFEPECSHNTMIKLKESASAQISEENEVSFMEFDEILSKTDKSNDNSSDDDNSESEQEDEYIIPDACKPTNLSKPISEQKNVNASGQISCATHSEAFSATQTLLRYVMNQDEVEDAEVNFIINFAKKIKGKEKISEFL